MPDEKNLAALEKSLMDIIHEFEIKLGYSKQTLRLFYPEKTLMRLLDCGADGLEEALNAFSDWTQLGKVRFESMEDRLCAVVPPSGAEYVHANYSDGGFLKRLIDAALHCPRGIDDILDVFRSYGEIECVFINNGEFDYLIYFTGGRDDDYRYCIKLHNGHAAYHRFTREDYEEFGF